MATERTMTALVNGSAVRFVIRKYFGKEWKRDHTRGAVNIWHEIESTAPLQIFLIGSSCPGSPSALGYSFSNHGKMKTIPAIAR